MNLTFELDLDCIKMNQHTEYVGQKSVCSVMLSGHTYTQTHRHFGPITPPGLLKWSEMKQVVKEF